MSEQEFNNGHIIEGLDRVNTIQTMIEELLKDHPAIKKADCGNAVDEVQSALYDIYKTVGCLEEIKDGSTRSK